MHKFSKQLIFAIALAAAIFMAGHIFQHLLPGFPEPLGSCQVCNALASLSVTTAAAIILAFLLIGNAPGFAVTAVPCRAVVRRDSRAPPLV